MKDESSIFTPLKRKPRGSPKRNMYRYPILAREAIQCQQSTRAAVRIANAALIDAKKVTRENRRHAVNPTKLAREKDRERNKLAPKLVRSGITLPCLFYDSKKDNETRVRIGKMASKKASVEHITLVEQPGGHYLGYVSYDTPKERTGIKETKVC